MFYPTLVILEGFKPSTFCLGRSYSIQLSYRTYNARLDKILVLPSLETPSTLWIDEQCSLPDSNW